eukprot:jgi/Tetstr1/459833/TSEL_005182.t1
MDQDKTRLPHLVPWDKEVEKKNLLQCHLTCVKYNGSQPDDVYYFFDCFPHDNSNTITVIYKTMKKEIERRGEALDTVWFQLDNTCRENKNKYVMCFCQWLVHICFYKEPRLDQTCEGMARKYADFQEELRVLTYDPITINTSTQRRKRRRGAQAATTTAEHSDEADCEADRQECQHDFRGTKLSAVTNMKGVSEIKDSSYKNLVVRRPLAKLRYTMQLQEEANRECGASLPLDGIMHMEITYELAKLRAALNVYKLDVDNKRRWFNDHRFNADEKKCVLNMLTI